MCLLAAMFVTFFNSLMTIFGRNCVLYFDLTGSYLFWSRSRNLILICHFSNDGEVDLEPVRPPPLPPPKSWSRPCWPGTFVLLGGAAGRAAGHDCVRGLGPVWPAAAGARMRGDWLSSHPQAALPGDRGLYKNTGLLHTRPATATGDLILIFLEIAVLDSWLAKSR